MKWYEWTGALVIGLVAAWMLVIGVKGALGSEIYMDNHTSCAQCHSQFPIGYGKTKNKNEVAPIPPNKVDLLCAGCHNPLVYGKFSLGGGTVTPITEGTFKDATGFAWKNITLYMDTNYNGKFDMGEPTAVTDDSGYFKFEAEGFPIRPIEGTIPDGYSLSVVVQDNVVTILSTAKQATVQGYVWADIDNNRKFDSNDNGIGNIIIFSDLNGNGLYNIGEPVTLTNADGSYLLVGVTINPTKIYCEIATVPEGYEFIGYNNPIDFTPQPAQIVTGVNFGFISPISVTSELHYPTRIAVTSDGYVVTDPKEQSVFMFDNTGKYTGQIKGLDKPIGVDVDEYGNIYVGTASGIDMYSSNGIWKGVFGLGTFKKPVEVVVHDNALYVLDSVNKNITVFENGTTRTIGDGQFKYPIAMAIRGNGIYVADRDTFQVKVFDKDGNVYSPFGGQAYFTGGRMGMPGTLHWEGLFLGMQAMTFDKYGRLHVLDTIINRVEVFTVNGTFLYGYGAVGAGNLQMDIGILSNGDVIMTNVTTRSVEKINEVQ